MKSDSQDLDELMRASVGWNETEDVDNPYSTILDGVEWRIRINDFPDEPLFSLFRNNKHIADFDDWPINWKR